MKKLLIIVAAVISVGVLNKSKNESVVIPSSSIRFRVVSNSNAPGDIKTKLNLKRKLEDYLYDKVVSASTVSEAEKIVSSELDNINGLIKQNLMSDNFTVSYGMNYFPSKTYKGVVYDGGYYNSLVVTLVMEKVITGGVFYFLHFVLWKKMKRQAMLNINFL